MKFFLNWITANQAIILAALVLASRIWSHFEHRGTERKVIQTEKKVEKLLNGHGVVKETK